MITCFNDRTCQEIRDILQHLNSTRQRCRLWYGDVITGKSWNEENDVLGRVGNSTGIQKIPILVYSKRSYGGGAILDDCIIRIDLTTGQTLYKHPGFTLGTWDLIPSQGPDSLTAVYIDRELHSQHKTMKQAERFYQFMTGLRYSK